MKITYRTPSLAHRLEYAGFLIIRFFLWRLSLPKAAAVSAFFWRLIAPHLSRHHRAEKNLSLAMPSLSISERNNLLLRMWDNLGRTVVEALRMHEIADNPQNLELNFSNEVLSIMANPKPAIFVSLHYGNWEVTAIAAEHFNKPLIGIYKRIENPYVDREVTRLRSRFYKGGLYSRAPDTVKNIFSGIKSGYSVAVMGDLRDSHGDAVPFFGQLSRSTNFPAILARRYDLPVVIIRAVRTSRGQFKIDAEKLELAMTGNHKSDATENTMRIQQKFEEWIREDPSLWMWGHRRW
jgi:Kdo2-lipid IVA lauroyltransferase/acyltransferase